MWVADGWKDYKLLDCSDGERLENWCGYTLVRPDPQVIWKGVRKAKAWKKPDGSYRRSKSGGGAWNENKLPEQWILPYESLGLRFAVKPMGFKHLGIFPEQAVNWEWITRLISDCGRPVKLLNLFAYTGGATVAAAKAGAAVCHVDASKGMVQMAKENIRLNGLADAPVRYIVDDCGKFVEREIRRGNFYDAVILDPPSYGRGPTGEIWKLEENLSDFLQLIAKVLSDKPLFVLLNSYTTGLSAGTMGYLLRSALLQRGHFGGSVEAEEIGLPVEATGGILPCGASARFIGK